MSAILSAEDLNDFITPGVACIKPVETLPTVQQSNDDDPYQVTTEDKVASVNAPPASISLTDCLACSGCVTSAEAVLVGLQSHAEVLSVLDAHPQLSPPWDGTTRHRIFPLPSDQNGKIFVASVSPQSRASIAATYGVTDHEAGNMIAQLLGGPDGLRSGGRHGSGFTWITDTNAMRQVALVAAADEVLDALDQSRSPSSSYTGPKRPVLTSACPGWICYAEKTHPHILPHISRVKSPQALTGTLLKSVLARKFGVPPDRVWHVAVMPCFDKKLEASRAELTDLLWRDDGSTDTDPNGQKGIRDVDCVITARELVMLAESRELSFASLSRRPVVNTIAFPDPLLDDFLFRSEAVRTAKLSTETDAARAGTSGGYLWHVMQTYKSLHPDSQVRVQRGRNADVSEYTLHDPATDDTLVKSARYYGFRNIQNLVRKMKVKKQSRMPGAAAATLVSSRRGRQGDDEPMSDYAYVEVMACPGGCTNGGGQIKVDDVASLRGQGDLEVDGQAVVPSQKAWLEIVDEAYFSADDDGAGVHAAGQDRGVQGDAVVDGISRGRVKGVMAHWADITGLALEKLVYTTYRAVDSDVGKSKVGDAERVAGLASSIGGGW